MIKIEIIDRIGIYKQAESNVLYCDLCALRIGQSQESSRDGIPLELIDGVITATPLHFTLSAAKYCDEKFGGSPDLTEREIRFYCRKCFADKVKPSLISLGFLVDRVQEPRSQSGVIFGDPNHKGAPLGILKA